MQVKKNLPINDEQKEKPHVFITRMKLNRISWCFAKFFKCPSILRNLLDNSSISILYTKILQNVKQTIVDHQCELRTSNTVFAYTLATRRNGRQANTQSEILYLYAYVISMYDFSKYSECHALSISMNDGDKIG